MKYADKARGILDATFNLTVYDMEKKLLYCFVWNESEAKKGANEFQLAC